MTEDESTTGEVLPYEPLATPDTALRGPGGRFAGGAVPGSGRRPGGLSRRTRDSIRIAEELGFHPVSVMISIITSGKLLEPDGQATTVPLDERLKLLREVAHYICPKVHAMEVTGRDGGPVAHAHVDVTHIMRNPLLADAAETLALAMIDQDTGRTVCGQDEFE